MSETTQQQLQSRMIGVETINLLYKFTQEGGSDVERRLLGKRLLDEANAPEIAAQEAARKSAEIEAAKKTAIEEFKAQQAKERLTTEPTTYPTVPLDTSK